MYVVAWLLSSQYISVLRMADSSVGLFPLSSQPLRLRSVTEVSLFKPPRAARSAEYSITFHQTARSLPFYSSPPATVSGGRAVFPVGDHDYGGSRSVVVKVWCDQRGGTVWGINLTALICLGEHLSHLYLAPRLKPNTLVFSLHSHIFLSPDSLIEPLTLRQGINLTNFPRPRIGGLKCGKLTATFS